MALQPLATMSDAAGYGFDETVDASHLMKASAFVHAEAGPRLVPTATSRTLTGRGPQITLPGPPASITSVTDEDGNVLTVDDWELAPGGLLSILTGTNATGLFSVVYSQAAVPDGVVFLVCQVAARLAATPASLAAGTQQETAGSESATYGWDAWKGQSGLTTGERQQLRRLLPKIPRMIVMSA